MASAPRTITLLMLLLACAGTATAETLGCVPVPPLPVVITVPGHYCLAADVVQDFGDNNGLRIAADDVVLDCNGHRIRHTAPAGRSGHGINVGDDRDNVTVRNCVVDGFYVGISVIQTFGAANATTRLLDNTVTNARVYGILAYGAGLVIEGNRIDRVLGNAMASSPSGILVNDSNGSAIRGNTIVAIRPETQGSGGPTVGLYMYNVRDSVIEDNTIIGLAAYTGTGVYAIYGDQTSGLAVNRNIVVSPPAPGTPPNDGGNYYAIWLNGPGVATNVCRDNITGHYNTNIAGCTQALNAEF